VFTPSGQFAADQAFLRDRLELFLQEQGFSQETGLGADIRQALAAPRKLSSLDEPVASSQNQIPEGIWALLPWHIARYCAPDADPLLVSRISLCAECFLCALDLLDDVEDDDETPLRKELGDARVLNVATALLALASQCLLEGTRHGLAPERAIALSTILHQQWLRATHGQHRDLLSERQEMQETRPEDCLRIIEEKSGALVRLVCLLATSAVGAPATITDLFADVGTLVGIAYQLDNDTHDLSNLIDPAFAGEGYNHKSDLVRGKKTLPIVLAQQRYASRLQKTLISTGRKQRTELTMHLQSYHEAIKASVAVGFYYRFRAESILRQIEDWYGVPVPPCLRFLLSLDSLPEEA